MSNNEYYIPIKGDIISFNNGKEIRKFHYGLVTSCYGFNKEMMLAVVCPITQKNSKSLKSYLLPKNVKVTGQVIVSQLESLDFTSREITFVDRLPFKDMVSVNKIIKDIFK